MFSFSKSVFRGVCTGKQTRSEVFSEDKIANFNDNGGFVVGHINIFCGDTRVFCFPCYTRGLCSQVTQRTNKL